MLSTCLFQGAKRDEMGPPHAGLDVLLPSTLRLWWDTAIPRCVLYCIVISGNGTSSEGEAAWKSSMTWTCRS